MSSVQTSKVQQCPMNSSVANILVEFYFLFKFLVFVFVDLNMFLIRVVLTVHGFAPC